jgi:hypothetical protein
MEGTTGNTRTVTIVTDRYGHQTEGTMTREEWFEHEREDPVVEVVRYHRELAGAAA